MFQRASCLVAHRTGASVAFEERSAARGFQCLVRSRREEVPGEEVDDMKQNTETNICALSTADMGTEVMDSDANMDALTCSESADALACSEPADGFMDSRAFCLLTTLPPLAEINTFHSDAPLSDACASEEAPNEAAARLCAQQAREFFAAWRQCRAARPTLGEESRVEEPQAELAQTLLVRVSQFTERRE